MAGQALARPARVYFIDRALATLQRARSRCYVDGHRRSEPARRGASRRRARPFAALAADQQDEVIHDDREDALLSGAARFDTIVGTFALPTWGGNRDYAGWHMLGFEHQPASSRPSATTMPRSTGEGDMAARQPPSVAARFQPSDMVDFVIVGSGAAGGIIAKELVDRRVHRGRARTGAAADRGAVHSRRVRHLPAEATTSTIRRRSRRRFASTPQDNGQKGRGRSSTGEWSAAATRISPATSGGSARATSTKPACSEACQARRCRTGRSRTRSSSPTTRRRNGSLAYRASRARSILRGRGPTRCRRCR